MEEEKIGISYSGYDMYPVGVFHVTHLTADGKHAGGDVGYGHLAPCQPTIMDEKPGACYTVPAAAYLPGIIREREGGLEVVLFLPRRRGQRDVPKIIVPGSIIRLGGRLLFKAIGADVPIHDQEKFGVIAHAGIIYREAPCDYEGFPAVLYQSTEEPGDVLSISLWEKLEL